MKTQNRFSAVLRLARSGLARQKLFSKQFRFVLGGLARQRLFRGVRSIVLGGLAAGILLGTSPFQWAQQPRPIKLKTPKAKLEVFRGTVLSMTRAAITVQGKDNPYAVRNFTYDPKLLPKLEKILDRGGYQHGDRVSVEFLPGTDTAVKIRGKPSKPI